MEGNTPPSWEVDTVYAGSHLAGYPIELPPRISDCDLLSDLVEKSSGAPRVDESLPPSSEAEREGRTGRRFYNWAGIGIASFASRFRGGSGPSLVVPSLDYNLDTEGTFSLTNDENPSHHEATRTSTALKANFPSSVRQKSGTAQLDMWSATSDSDISKGNDVDDVLSVVMDADAGHQEPQSSRKPDPPQSSEGQQQSRSSNTIRKRPRAPSESMPPSESEEPPQKSRKSKASTEGARVILACPFYKRDPGKYRSCRRFFLTKISYVKQHILRSHRMPPHCQICNRLFQTDEQQLEHVRSQTCDRQPYQPPEGVTQAQIALLRGRVDQKKGLEGQWYEIYEILFPAAQKPSSVYLDPELSQDLDEFANFLTSRGPNILLDKVNFGNVERASAAGERLVADVSAAFQDIYDLWYSQRSRDVQEHRDILEHREPFTPTSAPTTPSTLAANPFSEPPSLRHPALSQPANRPPPSAAGSVQYETSFATRGSSGYERTPRFDFDRKSLPGTEAPSALESTSTLKRRSSQGQEAGRRNSPRPGGLREKGLARPRPMDEEEEMEESADVPEG